jgi:hypothetical protein
MFVYTVHSRQLYKPPLPFFSQYIPAVYDREESIRKRTRAAVIDTDDR